MKVRATVSFCGPVSLCKGQSAELPEEAARELIRCGYAEEVKEESKARKRKSE